MLVCTSALSCTCTSSDGGFSLLPGSGSVWVKIPGGGSRTIVSASGGPGTISAPALRPVQVVPPCPPASKGLTRLLGLRLAILVPKQLRSMSGGDVDYLCESARATGSADFLRECFGPHWSYGLPHAEELASHAPIEERELSLPWLDEPSCSSRITPLLEYRGTSSDGDIWRWIGMLGHTFEYHTKSAAAAREFDALLDTLCTE